jgi:hypothetical protein
VDSVITGFLPIWVVTALGWLAGRLHLLGDDAGMVLGRFAFTPRTGIERSPKRRRSRPISRSDGISSPFLIQLKNSRPCSVHEWV